MSEPAERTSVGGEPVERTSVAGNQLGLVVLVGTPIGNLGDLSPRAVKTLADADLICCEDTRQTRKLLTHAGIRGAHLVAFHQHNEAAVIPRILDAARAGRSVAVVSDAGMPAISDPGERLVAAAVSEGIAVSVVPGPNAALSALVLSGFSLERFAFEGFLPARGTRRHARLDGLAGEERTVALYEAPHRLRRTLDDLVLACGADRPVLVAGELTKRYESQWRGSLAGAVAAFAEGETEPRGEYVIVLAGRPPLPPPDPGALAEAAATRLRHRIAAGDDTKTAIAETARELGLARREVYELNLRLKRHEGPVP